LSLLIRNIIFLVCIATSTFAGNLKLQQANMLYHNQVYSESAELYMQMVKDGYKDKAIYYNAGNAFYKSNEMGKAHWCFLKAQEQDKGNILIDENIALTRQKAGIGSLKTQRNLLSAFYHKLLNIHSPNYWAIYAFVFFSLSAFIFSLRKFFNLHSFFMAFQKLCFYLFLFHIFGILGTELHKRYTQQGIILKDIMKGESKRNKESKAHFLKEGEIVDVLQIVKDKDGNEIVYIKNYSGQNTMINRNLIWNL
jgi:hypothetical protein